MSGKRKGESFQWSKPKRRPQKTEAQSAPTPESPAEGTASTSHQQQCADAPSTVPTSPPKSPAQPQPQAPPQPPTLEQYVEKFDEKLQYAPSSTPLDVDMTCWLVEQLHQFYAQELTRLHPDNREQMYSEADANQQQFFTNLLTKIVDARKLLQTPTEESLIAFHTLPDAIKQACQPQLLKQHLQNQLQELRTTQADMLQVESAIKEAAEKDELLDQELLALRSEIVKAQDSAQHKAQAHQSTDKAQAHQSTETAQENQNTDHAQALQSTDKAQDNQITETAQDNQSTAEPSQKNPPVPSIIPPGFMERQHVLANMLMGKVLRCDVEVHLAEERCRQLQAIYHEHKFRSFPHINSPAVLIKSLMRGADPEPEPLPDAKLDLVDSEPML